ncbi:MAG: 3-hydroxyacyl-[acyl-carrier-protein] dehydratase FabZ [Dehalococcoidia bacterium]|nr:3-hydroxyacyl-[acyl-carrier-protein] dehydratase FabZ [Dehalococcoidia bacterium]
MAYKGKNVRELLSKADIYSKYLPHGPQWQYLDEIRVLSDTEAIAIVNITNEHCLGHFPGNPVFPGVLQAECFGQTLGVLAQVAQGKLRAGFYREADVVFRGLVVPGDQLELYVTMDVVRLPLVKGKGQATVGSTTVSVARTISLALG